MGKGKHLSELEPHLGFALPVKHSMYSSHMTSITQSAASFGLCETHCGQAPAPLRSARRPFLNPLHFLLQFCHIAAAILVKHS